MQAQAPDRIGATPIYLSLCPPTIAAGRIEYLQTHKQIINTTKSLHETDLLQLEKWAM
jgi:hypothetical protein